MKHLNWLCLVITLINTPVYTQDTTAVVQNDSLQVQDTSNVYEHKPKTAALLSLLPGAGQIYNEIGYRKVSQKRHRAWWKVPIIYGGIGVCGYYFFQKFETARSIRREWEYREQYSFFDETNPQNSEFFGVTLSGLESDYDEIARQRDIFLFATIGIYGLNIIEAFVDGHFVSFDVSEDLSLNIRPTIMYYNTPGINLSLNFN